MTEATHRPPPPVIRLRHSGPSMSNSSLPGIGAAKGAGAGGAGQGSDTAALYGYKLPGAQNSQNGTEPSTRERRLSALRRGGSGSAECAEEGGGGGENSGAGYKSQTEVDLAGVSDPSCSTRPPSPALNSSTAAATATAITNTNSATASAPSPAYSLRSRPSLPESFAQAGPSTLVTAVPRQSRLRRTSASALTSTSSASTTADASAGTMPRKPPAKPGKRRATAGRRRKAESDLESEYGSYSSSLSGGASTPAGDPDMDGSSGFGSGSDGSYSTSNGSGSRSSKGKGKAARTTRHGQSHSSRRNSNTNHTASRLAGQGYSHGRSTRATRNLDDEPLITLEDVIDELSAINAECRRCHVELREVEGDGSCFFRAVSQCLWGHQGHHELLRQATCDQMFENKEGLRVWEAGWGGSVEGLVDDMRKSSVFAHGPVLPALAEMIGWDLWLVQAEHSHRVVSANPNHTPHPRRISSPGFKSLDIPAPEQGKTALWLAFQFKGTHYNSISLPSGFDRHVGTGEGERGPQLSWIPDRYMQPHANDKSQEGQAWRARLASLTSSFPQKSKADGEGEGQEKGERYRARLPSPATSADTTGTNTSGTDGTGDAAGTEGSGSTTTTEPASPAESAGSSSVPAAALASASISIASSASASATAPQSDGDTSTTSQATGSAVEFPSSPFSDHSVSSNSPRNRQIANSPRYSPEHAGTGSPKLGGKFKVEKQRSPVSPYARPISGQDPQQQQHQEKEARIERERARERKRQEAREAREAEARRRRREAEALENDGFFIDDSPHRPKSHSHARPSSSVPRSSTSRSKSQTHSQPQPQSRSRSSYDAQQAEIQEEQERQELRRRALQRLQAVRARRGSGSAASVISVSSGGSSEDGMEVEAMIA